MKSKGWHHGLNRHIARTVYKDGSWKSPHFLHSVAGYLRQLANRLDKKANELDGTLPKTSKKEELITLLVQYPDAINQRLIEILGVSRSYFYRLLKEVNNGRT